MVWSANQRSSALGRRLRPLLWPGTEHLVHFRRIPERLQVEHPIQDRCRNKVRRNYFTWYPWSSRWAWHRAYAEIGREDRLLGLEWLLIHVRRLIFLLEDVEWHVAVWFYDRAMGEDQAIGQDPRATLRPQHEHPRSEDLPVWRLNRGHSGKQLVLQVRYWDTLLDGVWPADRPLRLRAIDDQALIKLR